ncbi:MULTISPECIES: DUF4124 domain-containing protein [Pseudomonadaceae]|uniref:DUF4124 domain-containing protein n=1 Tax=Pseudomonadaceae TaxID=135621 RepID=UPI001038CFFF|nr:MULTISPECIES: DUF4124 domain-containing protein [Pseudomonadaceae]MBA1276989.1 DUF4124 domain-containing protein [Stutzerimonas stutzeri]MBC8651225.1 DUF4124 domain-containing protein [Pseudomonas sp. MT4]QXY93440.1 DUF4124 domain-containing protein [Pseudomonas sp. MTM4]TCD23101.1 DUF4124 domain-containing protein [Pseudomonas sp. IC_126]
MRLTIFAGGLLLALSSSVMASQVYKWVDAQGVTHFGAQPPQGQPAEALNTATPPPRPAPAAPATSEPSAESEQREIDRQVKKQVAEQEAERQRYCTSLRTNLAQLQNNPRVRVEEDGKIRRLKEEERQERITETSQKIADTCNQ